MSWLRSERLRHRIEPSPGLPSTVTVEGGPVRVFKNLLGFWQWSSGVLCRSSLNTEIDICRRWVNRGAAQRGRAVVSRDDGGVVDDGGDAVHSGREGGGLVAGCVLDGDGVVAGRGVGVGDDLGLPLRDGGGEVGECDTSLDGVLSAGHQIEPHRGGVGGDGQGTGEGVVELNGFGLAVRVCVCLAEHEVD